MTEQSWAKHVADVLRRNDIRLFATVPDYIVSQVLDELWADSRVPRGHGDREKKRRWGCSPAPGSPGTAARC